MAVGFFITNEEIRRKTKQRPLIDVIKKGRLPWLGNLHRREEDYIPKETMDWKQDGQRMKGKLVLTWRQMVEKDLMATGKAWFIAKQVAQDHG